MDRERADSAAPAAARHSLAAGLRAPRPPSGRFGVASTQSSSAIHRNRRGMAQSLASLGARAPLHPTGRRRAGPASGRGLRRRGQTPATASGSRQRSGAVNGTSGRLATRAGLKTRARGRTRLVGAAVAASATAALVWSATGSAAVTAPHFINVFPSRDFVHIEGYNAGDKVT